MIEAVERKRVKMGTLRYPVEVHEALKHRASALGKTWNAMLLDLVEDLLRGRLCLINPRGEIMRLDPAGGTPVLVGTLPLSSTR